MQRQQIGYTTCAYQAVWNRDQREGASSLRRIPIMDGRRVVALL